MTPIYGARGLEAGEEDNMGLGDIRGLGGHDDDAYISFTTLRISADTII